jgi:hypothetical protein
MAEKQKKTDILDIVPTGSQEGMPGKPESALKRKVSIFFHRLLNWMILIGAGLLIGAAIIFFVLYLPKYSAWKQLKSENASLTTEYTQAQADLTQSQQDYASCSDNLLATQNTLNQTASVKYAALMLYQSSAARTALEEGNKSSATSNLSNAASYLQSLKPLVDDQAQLHSIETSLSAAQSKLLISPDAAKEDINTLIQSLYDFLLLLSNNP